MVNVDPEMCSLCGEEIAPGTTCYVMAEQKLGCEPCVKRRGKAKPAPAPTPRPKSKHRPKS